MAWCKPSLPLPLTVVYIPGTPHNRHDAFHITHEFGSASPCCGPGTQTLLVQLCNPSNHIYMGVSLTLGLQQQSASTTLATSTTAAAPSATPDYEAICESQASSYADSCPQCLYRCIGSAYVEDCYYSTFFTVNGIQAQCEAQGGRNCRQQALAAVCPGPSSS